MKYEIDYKQYHFLIETDLSISFEYMQVVYKDTLIIRAGFFRLWCSVGYNSEFIRVREENKLDEVFKNYRGDVLKIVPQVIEVLCGEYVPKFVKIESFII